MRVVVVGGGVGGSRFVAGVREAYPEASIEVVVNTADDVTLHGLRICPDLDTMMYSLGGGIDPDKGWGRAQETHSLLGELREYGVEPTWFGLGDKDIATHLIRTQLLDSGARLTEVTAALGRRWLPDRVTLLPMSDDRVESHVVIADADAPSGRRTVHFQEYWVRLRARPEALACVQVGIDDARATPEVLRAIGAADLILLAPSNPVVSIGPVLAVPGIRTALAAASAPVIGFAGIIAGRPVLGMAERLLPAIGVEVTAEAVGRHYRHRSTGGVLDAWVVHSSDADAVAPLERDGLPTLSTELIMSDPAATARFVSEAVERFGATGSPRP